MFYLNKCNMCQDNSLELVYCLVVQYTELLLTRIRIIIPVSICD